jgi:hypothetical protein
MAFNFPHSCAQKRINHKNNAPGGPDGVDIDVQYRLGAPGHNLAEIKDRKHGICCGLTVAWIIGFCSGEIDTGDPNYFAYFFDNPGRFQGAYIKDFRGNVRVMDDIEKISAIGLIKIGDTQSISYRNIGPFLPQENHWAAYLGAWHHAIGIGKRDSIFDTGNNNLVESTTYYIMDPNAGLFMYNNDGSFLFDLQSYLDDRHTKKSPSSHDIKLTFFKNG